MNWIITKLKDLPINIIDGDRSAKYPKREEFCAEGVAFLNSTNISGNTLDLSEVNFITNEKFAQINKGRFQGGDILMTTRGSIGKVAWVRHGFHGLINAQMLILRANPEALESRFLFSLLSSAESQQTLKNFASGSAQPQIPIRDLREIEVRVPPVGIQRRIAAILSAYDDLIENNTRRIAILEEMASRIYEEWFVRFRFPGHEGVRMVESELGLVPQGWNFAAVQDVMETHGGGTPSKTEPGYWTDGQVNWYSPTDLTRAKTVFMGESSNKITDLGLSKSSAKLFPPMSVMMTSRATLGVIAVNTTAASTNQGFITCIPSERFPLWLLYHWLKENAGVFESLATGATFKEITKGVFRKIELVVPPTELTKAFELSVGPMMSLVLQLELKNQNLRTTRDLLLPKLISGELDVSTLPEPQGQTA